MHYVYVLRCGDGSLYTGYTTDVGRRLDEHRDGDGAKYTRGRDPLELVHVESFPDRSAAMSREYEIKQQSRPAKARLVENSSTPQQPPVQESSPPEQPSVQESSPSEQPSVQESSPSEQPSADD